MDLPGHPGSRSGNLVNSPNSDPGTTTDFYDSEQLNYPEEAYDYEEGNSFLNNNYQLPIINNHVPMMLIYNDYIFQDEEDEDYYEQSESRTKFRQQS